MGQAASCEGRLEGLSRMKRKFHVRFLALQRDGQRISDPYKKPISNEGYCSNTR
jgi:hypothetical protein